MAIAIALAGASAGALTVGGVPTVAGVHNLQFDDVANSPLPLPPPFNVNLVRDYVLKIPVGYVHGAGTEHRLLVLLHGGGQALADFVTKPHILDFAARADANGVILAAPAGYVRTWNAAHRGPPARGTTDDVAFFADFIGELVGALDIDPKRVHLVGYSQGGMMVHRLAAELTTLIASGATVAGPVGGFNASTPLLVAPGCEPYEAGCADWNALETPTPPSDPIPMMMIRGLRDPTIVYEGGSSNPRVWHLPAVANTAVPGDTDYGYWTGVNGCAEQPIVYHPVGQLRDCLGSLPAAADVRMVSLCGMTHEWPTAANSAGFDAVEHIVEFLDAHPRP